jgi:hypothetical protein
MDLKDIYKISHLMTAEYVIPAAYATFSKTDHILG